MSDTAWIVLGVVAILIVLAFLFRGRPGSTEVTLPGAGVKMRESERSVAEARKVKAGRNLTVRQTSGGDARAEHAQAGEDINVSAGPTTPEK